MLNSWIYFVVIIVLFIIGVIVLAIVGSKMQKKQDAQRAQAEANAQPVTMMIIDKKIMKIKDAKLQKSIMEQIPKRMRNAKMPIVKAKIGPQIMSLICDDAVYDQVPTKGEVKAMVSGIYIIGVKNIRGTVEAPTKKRGFAAKLRSKQQEYRDTLAKEDQMKKERERQEKIHKDAKKLKK